MQLFRVGVSTAEFYKELLLWSRLNVGYLCVVCFHLCDDAFLDNLILYTEI